MIYDAFLSRSVSEFSLLHVGHVCVTFDNLMIVLHDVTYYLIFISKITLVVMRDENISRNESVHWCHGVSGLHHAAVHDFQQAIYVTLLTR